MRIYGIGLPRTGTSSLSKALNDLGFSASHICVLKETNNPSPTGTRRGQDQYGQDVCIAPESYFVEAGTTSVTQGYTSADAIVYNGFYKNFRDLIGSNSKFILTTRSEIEWEKSIRRFPETPKDIPDIKEYERDVLDSLSKKGLEKNLLVLNVFTSKHTASLLCDFLGIDNPDYAFPHLNATEN